MRKLWAYGLNLSTGERAWMLIRDNDESGFVRLTMQIAGCPTAIEYTGKDRLDRQTQTFAGRKARELHEAEYPGAYSSLVYAVRAQDPTASIEEDGRRFAVVIHCQPWLEIPVRYAAWCHLTAGVLLEVNPKPVPPARPFMKPAQNRMQRFWAWLSNGLSNDGGLPL